MGIAVSIVVVPTIAVSVVVVTTIAVTVVVVTTIAVFFIVYFLSCSSVVMALVVSVLGIMTSALVIHLKGVLSISYMLSIVSLPQWSLARGIDRRCFISEHTRWKLHYLRMVWISRMLMFVSVSYAAVVFQQRM